MKMNSFPVFLCLKRHQRAVRGSAASQVAVLTERIRNLTEHMKNNHKDEHSKRGLLLMVNRRKKLLAYIKKNSVAEYEELIKKLGLRK